ncbi:TIGR04222 domain-containing membrane protein [Novosphingobium sp. FSY-8]|uniref:TIGR04222 domain-containing membrane protein n=1 Tax=Novosphingobium ovatum TaxID=1908523 RepID=A0ABW9XBJ8_9SPHN|nr:TIGR04222 domain-containing membrane protein [Novosphingobium ovatum]NBC35918.1 TIGR04222 domain-containing membrane protein [Novosphingobium ovatum]
MDGSVFAGVFVGLMVAAMVASWLLPRMFRPSGAGGAVTDPLELACLAGGIPRYVEALVTRLMARGCLGMDEDQRFTVLLRDGRTGAENELLNNAQGADFAQLLKVMRPYGQTVVDGLVERGLWANEGALWQQRFWRTGPYVLVLLIGGARWAIGYQAEEEVGGLGILMALLAIIAYYNFKAGERRTTGGQAALEAAQASSERLKRAPTQEEAATAVALFGTAVLAGSALNGLHLLRTAGASDAEYDHHDSSNFWGENHVVGGCGGCSSDSSD